jgi:hypothetical protein
MPRIKMSMRIGPMVHFEIEGQSCTEIASALHGFEQLNRTVDSMFSDLAERVYPDGEAEHGHAPRRDPKET